MCGRFGLFEKPEALEGHFHLEHRVMLEDYERHWNISPTMPILTVAMDENQGSPDKNNAKLRRWGLRGHSSRKSKGANRLLINARGETVHKLRSFREAFKSRRCLIPASGFFEWKKETVKGKTPVWFHREDRAPIAFAGIWSSEAGPDGPVEACSIVTCEPNSLASRVHHRMPVILPPGRYSTWISPDADTDPLLALLQPVEWPEMAWHPVSKEVNRSVNDYPSLVEPAPTHSSGEGANLLLGLP